MKKASSILWFVLIVLCYLFAPKNALAVLCCTDSACADSEFCSGENCSDPYNEIRGTCTANTCGSCQDAINHTCVDNDDYCGTGCRQCTVTCHDQDSYCAAPTSQCSAGQCVVPPSGGGGNFDCGDGVTGEGCAYDVMCELECDSENNSCQNIFTGSGCVGTDCRISGCPSNITCAPGFDTSCSQVKCDGTTGDCYSECTPCPPPPPPPPAQVPNCDSLDGPTKIELGSVGSYSANFTSPAGNLSGAINSGQNGIFSPVAEWSPSTTTPISGTSGSLSYVWTPTAIGTYNVFCRARNGDIAECRGNQLYVDRPPIYLCAGPTTTKIVNVCDPNIWSYGDCVGSPASRIGTNGCGGQQSSMCHATINARAVRVASGATDCTSVDYLDGTQHEFTISSASQPSALTQSGSSYVQFTGDTVYGGNYTLNSTVPSGYTFVYSCWTKDKNAPLSATAVSASTTVSKPIDDETLTWDMAYTYSGPWFQTQGGSVHAQGNLKSTIPIGTPQQVFNKDGSAPYPGLVTYGTAGSCDFNGDNTCGGETIGGNNVISSTNWLANQPHTSVHYYDYFYNRLGAPAGVAGGTLSSELTSQLTPYYYTSDVTIDTVNWSVGDGETIIVLVNGNLTIKKNITITGTGFVAFIVNGTITIDPSVGTDSLVNNTPQIQGIYIATNADKTGTFITGASTSGTERLVLKGSFIADTFLLQRDLDMIAEGDNVVASAELFIYDPNLFIHMPESMKNIPVTWEEVAP